MSDRLDRWISARIRGEIERQYYVKINEQATLDRLVDDPAFMADPLRHVGLFADHGVVHVRDVANQILDVLSTVHGVLIPRRDERRFAFMQGYGVLLAYFHDIGMVDFSDFGRAMHPEFAAQAVFSPILDDLMDAIWLENSGGVPWHLLTLVDQNVLRQDPRLVLRELLSLSICHSKSKISVDLLNDPAALRARMIHVVKTDIHDLFATQQGHNRSEGSEQPAGPPGQPRLNPGIMRYAHLFPDEAYNWLIDSHPALMALVADVIDTTRALRAADALRQRGTVLETSGHYQVFVDQYEGNAIYALRLGRERLYLLELADPVSAGESNIASTELDPTGDLRVSFHRGVFRNPGATERAAYCAALVLFDIQRDVIESFERIDVPAGLKPAVDAAILLEDTEDNAAFVQLVQERVAQLDAACAARIASTPSLTNVHAGERARYLAAKPMHWQMTKRRALLARMGRTGYPADRVDPMCAFRNVRLLKLNSGEVLIEAGTPASFVYLPMGVGLTINPLGGYQSFPAEPWVLLGATGVIRGAERSATVFATRALEIVMIPKSVYLSHWHHTLSLEEFQLAVGQNRAGDVS